MTPGLGSLLFSIRQHASFKELLAAIETPIMPRYRPLRDETLESMGAKTVFASGQIDQHERWIAFLTGGYEESPRKEKP